jgi:hypothetical protein
MVQFQDTRGHVNVNLAKPEDVGGSANMPSVEPARIQIETLGDNEQMALFHVFDRAFDRHLTWEVEKAKLGQEFADRPVAQLVADIITLIDSKGKEAAYRAVGADDEMVADMETLQDARLQKMVSTLTDAAGILSASSLSAGKRRAELLLDLAHKLQNEGPDMALDGVGCDLPKSCTVQGAVALYIAAMFCEDPFGALSTMITSKDLRYVRAIGRLQESLQRHLERKGAFADRRALDRVISDLSL